MAFWTTYTTGGYRYDWNSGGYTTAQSSTYEWKGFNPFVIKSVRSVKPSRPKIDTSALLSLLLGEY